jgi:hypothetical protein
LANLPVAVAKGALEGGVDLASTSVVRVEERREGENGATADRRLVAGRGEDRIEGSLVTDRAEGGDARFAGERIRREIRCQIDQPVQHVVADLASFAARPRRNLDDRVVRIGQRTSQVDARVAGGDRRGPPPDRCVGVGEGGDDVAVGGRAEALEGAEGCGANRRIGRVESCPGRVRIALVPGEGDAASRRLDRQLSPSAGSSSS